MDVETSEAIGQLGERIDALDRSLRNDFRDYRQHSDSILEGIRDEIRTLTTNVVALSAKVDSRPS